MFGYHCLFRYEERSLGIYENPEDSDDEPDLSGTPRERIGKYLNWHLRRQLSIGHTNSLIRRMIFLCHRRYLVACLGCLPHLHHRTTQYT